MLVKCTPSNTGLFLSNTNTTKVGHRTSEPPQEVARKIAANVCKCRRASFTEFFMSKTLAVKFNNKFASITFEHLKF